MSIFFFFNVRLLETEHSSAEVYIFIILFFLWYASTDEYFVGKSLREKNKKRRHTSTDEYAVGKSQP